VPGYAGLLSNTAVVPRDTIKETDRHALDVVHNSAVKKQKKMMENFISINSTPSHFFALCSV
jgi:hypothetical protein